MTALYIVLGILLFLALVLFSSISLKVSIDENFSMVLKFWFIKVKIPSDKKSKPKKPKKESQKEAENTPKKGYFKQSIEKKGLSATLSEISDVLKIVLSEFDGLLKHFRISDFKLLINVASDDPAKTAIEYGTVCSVVFPLVRLIEVKTKLSRNGTKVTVNSDFTSEKPELKFNLKGKLMVAHILCSGLRLLKILVQLKMDEQNNKNENKG